ncbi:MAG: serine hydroxymethyltransferase, partial [Polyangiales bacterium]
DNARALAETLRTSGIALVTGGTDNHLLLCDLGPQGVPGKVAARALNAAGIVCNANAVPFDPRKPFDPSGIRLGTPALTARGFGVSQMTQVGTWIADVVAAPEDRAVQTRVQREVAALCDDFPAPGLQLVGAGDADDVPS